MSQLKKSLAFLFFLSIVTITFQVKAQNPVVEKLHQMYVTVINTGNPATLDVLYAKDASVRNSDGSMIAGLENIKAQYNAILASGKYNITLETIEETLLNKEYMLVNGSFVFAKLDEPKDVENGQFVSTLKKIDGNWKIYKSYRYTVATNNAAVVGGLYKAFAKGDIPTALAAMDSNIVWNEAEGNALAAGNPYVGPDAVLNGVFASLPVDFENFRLADIKLIEMSNNQVLSTLRYNGTSKHNGKKLDAQAAHLWTVMDGKITAFQQYVDTKQLDEMLKK